MQMEHKFKCQTQNRVWFELQCSYRLWFKGEWLEQEYSSMKDCNEGIDPWKDSIHISFYIFRQLLDVLLMQHVIAHFCCDIEKLWFIEEKSE